MEHHLFGHGTRQLVSPFDYFLYMGVFRQMIQVLSLNLAPGAKPDGVVFLCVTWTQCAICFLHKKWKKT